ncbi:aryl-alcohol dehydrogenase-like predicted oxidoreductase [Ilumatobacter fluminis]|uniref:Aryl-alcohol dehydrogenase-like predicted oxidoreductase n=1 Tax=Ilumatobacter fluminis TaxID=467091 RepID=A0A4R7I2G6_9ACTN|nr:aldo/keto reductase [Ilumatobacter fluminis]TDT16826.1 aryl-alcohol dehydrogenase-like predicted oxidoreductase [Ilumatobacter fluminis]
MEHVRFGRTGLRVSKLCLGTMTFGFQCDDETSFAIMDTAYDAGISFFDTADVYPIGGPVETIGRTEELIGRWMARHGRRDDIVLATKCFFRTGPNAWDQGNSRKNIMRAIDRSLERLGTDYVDLYQIHFFDPHTPIDETLQALDDLVRSGKVRYVGCSNTMAYQLARAIGRSEALGISRFEAVQPRYNLLFRENERELFRLCDEDDVAVIPYNPLAGGLLTGKHRQGAPTEGTRFTLGGAGEMYSERYWQDQMFASVEDLRAVAEDAGVPMTTMAIQWVLANPVVTAPIIGASRPEQLAASVAAVESPIDADVKAKLDELTALYRQGDHER